MPSEVVRSGSYNQEETAASVFSPERHVDDNPVEEMFDTSDHESSFQILDHLREMDLNKLKEEINPVLSRENIYEEMIGFYQKRTTVLHRIEFKFEGEQAVGDRVNRDAYSEFFEALYRKMEGELERVPMNNMDEDELETVGKIITHAYVQYGLFPLGLSKVAMKHALFGIDTAINDKELVSSFHKFITPAESDKINDLLKGKNIDVQALIDIFGDYGVFNAQIVITL